MGIDWMILRPKRKEYLTLPKRGEWCNDLWKIWDILQDLEHGEKLIFINDESKEYGDILNNKEWSKADLSDDPELRLYRAEDIVAGGHSALYDALRYKEKAEKDARGRVSKSHDTPYSSTGHERRTGNDSCGSRLAHETNI